MRYTYYIHNTPPRFNQSPTLAAVLLWEAMSAPILPRKILIESYEQLSIPYVAGTLFWTSLSTFHDSVAQLEYAYSNTFTKVNNQTQIYVGS